MFTILDSIGETLTDSEILQISENDLLRILAGLIIDYRQQNLELISQARKKLVRKKMNIGRRNRLCMGR